MLIVVTDGPDKCKTFLTNGKDAVLIGRNEVDLSLSDTAVSRYHCRLKKAGEQWYIRDLDSRHGTQVNGKPIEGRFILNDGDRIGIGKTLIRVFASPSKREQHETQNDSGGAVQKELPAENWLAAIRLQVIAFDANLEPAR